MAANTSDFVTSLHHSCILYDPQYLVVHVHLNLHIPLHGIQWWWLLSGGHSPLFNYQQPTSAKQLYDVPQPNSCMTFHLGRHQVALNKEVLSF